MTHPPDLFTELLWQVGYAICHQLPERSLLIAGQQLPVCARDTGTMLAFGAVLLYYLLGRRWERAKLPDLAVLAAAAVGLGLYALDGLSSYIGLRETSNQLRLLSGLGMGLAVGCLMLSLLSALRGGDRARRTFTWRDLVLLVPLLAAIFLAVQADLGLPWYYLVASLTVAFLVALMALLCYCFIRAAAGERLPSRPLALPALSVLAACGLLAGLWAFHRLTGAAVGLP